MDHTRVTYRSSCSTSPESFWGCYTRSSRSGRSSEYADSLPPTCSNLSYTKAANEVWTHPARHARNRKYLPS
ncbi:hypothetical protein RRG08_044967 [Elysia crispata]|uniref:Uncharacterized protein n=1 Tax=Elysia crispata TaxID=231223 RepID=A0AAE1DLN0_9GAST|nr:hypothetical protein RRG08_044967 [Elysia crispata]